MRQSVLNSCNLLTAIGLSAITLVGCQQPPKSGTSKNRPASTATVQGMQSSPLESTNILRAFEASGVIRALSPDSKTLLVKHDEIQGYMPAMTMELDVRNPSELRGLDVGDSILFVLKADQNESWIEDIRRATPEDLNRPITLPSPPAIVLRAASLKPGDPFPDAELLSETGRTIRFSDYLGKAVAFTFIFTRCPLPNFCPRMNQNFSKARELLVFNPEAGVNWQFISISFDPEFDKPGVLSRYAYSYRGEFTNNWVFASAATNVLGAMSPLLDFRLDNEAGSFQHNLRTVVLDTKGRVYRQFDGNDWKPQNLAQSMIEASR